MCLPSVFQQQDIALFLGAWCHIAHRHRPRRAYAPPRQSKWTLITQKFAPLSTNAVRWPLLLSNVVWSFFALSWRPGENTAWPGSAGWIRWRRSGTRGGWPREGKDRHGRGRQGPSTRHHARLRKIAFPFVVEQDKVHNPVVTKRSNIPVPIGVTGRAGNSRGAAQRGVRLVRRAHLWAPLDFAQEREQRNIARRGCLYPRPIRDFERRAGTFVFETNQLVAAPLGAEICTAWQCIKRDDDTGELANLTGLHAKDLEEYDNTVTLVDQNSLILGLLNEKVLFGKGLPNSASPCRHCRPEESVPPWLVY